MHGIEIVQVALMVLRGASGIYKVFLRFVS